MLQFGRHQPCEEDLLKIAQADTSPCCHVMHNAGKSAQPSWQVDSGLCYAGSVTFRQHDGCLLWRMLGLIMIPHLHYHCLLLFVPGFLVAFPWLPMAAMTSHVLQGSMRVAPAMEHRRTSREALPVVPLAFHVPAATCITAGGALVSTATAFMLRRLSGPQKPEQVVPKRLGWKNGLGKDPGKEILHSN